ncbi:MarR family EPS-associated transcriptional regulator [Methylophilaceae bacterium]|nr:MarR family EPS-associated transcriptional regulator [Methylophilaceae bacterium]
MNTKNKTQHPDTLFRVMDMIYKHPDISQRELAKQAGISLGSMHFCLKALAQKGWVKAGNFKKNPDKSVYLYLLTPEGIKQKSKLAIDFLKRKRQEYIQLKHEIDSLSEELRDEA